MDSTRTIQLRWLHGTLGEVSVTRVQFWRGRPHTWQPAVDAFRCSSAVSICVDLAGVEKALIDLRIEPRRVVVRGRRAAPEPRDRAVQVLALEIDYGPFEREVELPVEIEVEETRAEQENGFLWIYLPIKKS